MTFNPIFQRYGRLFRLLLIIFGIFPAIAVAQGGEKIIHVKQLSQITDAAVISNVSVDGRPIECGLFVKPPAVIQPVKPFEAGPNWLEQTDISLVNRTDRTIVFGSLTLQFSDTGDCTNAPCVSFGLTFGTVPSVDAYDGRTGLALQSRSFKNHPIDWQSEQTIVIHVSDYMSEIEHQLEPFGTATTQTKINITRGPFYFADGMTWNLGRFGMPDVDHPGKFKFLPASYFPGKRGNNWPPGYNH